MSSHRFSNTPPTYGSTQSPTRQAVPRPLGHSSQIMKTGQTVASWSQNNPTWFDVCPEIDNEELRVQVNTLRYELENFKQERDLMSLRHEKERRDLQLKADTDFRKAQVSLFYSKFHDKKRWYGDSMARVPRPPAIVPTTRANLWQENWKICRTVLWKRNPP